MLSKSRKGDAIKVLNKLRPAEDAESGVTRLEIEAIDEFNNSEEKAPWLDLVVREMPRSIKRRVRH